MISPCSFSQNNFSFTNVRAFQSVYTCISVSGTPVTITNPESGSSTNSNNTNFVQLDVRKLPPGTYWIRFEDESGNFSKSFIKQ